MPDLVAPMLALLVVLLPLSLGTSLWVAPGSDGGDPNLRVALMPADLASIGLLAIWCRRTIRTGWSPGVTARRPSLLAQSGLALAALLVVAFLVHPSPRGAELLLRLLAAAATADLFRRISRGRDRTTILAALVIVGSLQALLAMAQSLKGRALGLSGIEFVGPLYPFGNSFAGRGGLGHPYHLACFLAVACGAAALGIRRQARPGLWALGLAICTAGIGVTFSRSALIGMAAALGVAVVTAAHRRDRRAALVAGAIVLGLAVGMAGFGNGWVAKSERSTNLSEVDSGRRDRAAEALRLTKTSPLVGVGPGRYVIALEDVQHGDLLPAHNLVLQEMAEAGVLAGLLVGLAFVLLGLRALRRGADALFVFLPLAPFFLLDAFPYTFPVGIAASGLWLGLLSQRSCDDESDDSTVAPGTDVESSLNSKVPV